MILHYLKIAWRNLLKYRTQSAVSILGLAVGLACFALSAFWMHYEMTYDTFHRDADRLYLVGVNDESFGGSSASFTPYALGRYLKEHYSEIEDYCRFETTTFFVLKDNRMLELPVLTPDTTALRMLDIRTLDGDESFLRSATADSRIAITEKTARLLFGTTDVIGRSVTDANRNKEYTIASVVSDWGVHTNFPYAFLTGGKPQEGWDDYWYRTLIKVKPGTDASRLLEKMNAHFPEELATSKYVARTGLTRFLLEPLTGLRATEGFIAKGNQTVQFRYITWFAAVGVLIIACAFLNYLTIYADRFRTRRREMALRQVCGAGPRSLVALLCTDFLLTVAGALVAGMALVELLMPAFLRYSLIQDADFSVYRSALLYITCVSAVMMAIVVLSVWLFRKRSLHGHLYAGSTPSGTAWRKGSVVLQLTVCLAFIFCTVAMQMQLHHLRRVDTGMDYRGRAAVSIWMGVDMHVWAEKIKALPMVTEVVRPVYWPLLGMGACTSFQIDGWTGTEDRLEKPLACERRRKEIAIRKVNGATVKDILVLFFREYALMLAVSALIAFPASWWAMKRWIENYNRQAEIGILPCLIIFAGVAACVAACIGHRIWKTANENPAEVVKSE